jgi:hypothetical protein
LVWLKHEKDFT